MSNRAKILIVEDQPPVAKAMAVLLRQAGCETKIAVTGAEAIYMAQTGSFDLITLDVDLPDTNGFEVCRELKANPSLPRTPVIFVSGRLSEQDMRHGLEAGAVDYITKPFGAELATRLLSHVKHEREVLC